MVQASISECADTTSSSAKVTGTIARWWYDRWVAEIAHMILGILCFAAIAILLKVYNGDALPLNLPLGLTLGAFVSTLAAIAKYALAVPLDSSLAVQKWLWYETTAGRPMLDFESFDNAARNPVSAVNLAIRVRGRSVASMGSLVVILSLGIDPFLQQVVNFAQRSSLDNRGTVPRVVDMEVHTKMMDDGVDAVGHQAQLYESMKASYLPNALIPTTKAFCPNTECSWPIFDTLGLCSSCTDISDDLSHGCRLEEGNWRTDFKAVENGSNLEPSMSCGWFFNVSDSQPMLMTGYNVNTSNNRTAQALLMRQLNLRDPMTDELYWTGSRKYKDIPNPLANFIVVTSPNIAALYANSTPSAKECVVQWCTKTIAGHFAEGSYQERVIAEYRNMTKREEALTVQEMETGLDYIYGQNVTIQPPNQDDTFFIGNYSTLKTRFVFDGWIPNYLTLETGSTKAWFRYGNDVPGNDMTAEANSSQWLVPSGIDKSVQEMMAIMSIALRDTVYSTPVLGSGVIETYVRVQWPFFILPIIVAVFTMILLIRSIWQTPLPDSGRKSSLYTLTHGLSQDVRERRGLSKTTMYRMREEAKHLHVFLARGSDQAHLASVNRRSKPGHASISPS